MGLITLVIGPVIAAATTMAVAGRSSAEVSATGSVVDRAGRSVLSVGQVVASRADDPSLDAVPLPVPTLTPPVELPVPAPVPLVVTPTPAPSPSPTARAVAKPAAATPLPSASPGSVLQIVLDAARSHGVDGAWMVRIARCESGLNPHAYNPAGPWIGLFQFLPSTFRAHGGTDIYSASQQANIAASMLARGQAHQWPVCSLR